MEHILEVFLTSIIYVGALIAAYFAGMGYQKRESSGWFILSLVLQIIASMR